MATTPPAAPTPAVPPPSTVSTDPNDIPFSLPTRKEILALEKKLKITGGKKVSDHKLKVTVLSEGEKGPISAPIIGLAIYAAVYFGIIICLNSFGLHGWKITNGLAGIVLAFAISFTHNKFWWSSQDAQTADAFSDRFNGGIIVMRGGFHWRQLYWKHTESVNFKQEEVRLCGKEKDATLFSTLDPFKCVAEWETVIKPINTLEGLLHWFSYKKDIREARIISVINSRIAVAGGKNLYTKILGNQAEFAMWVEQIFGGEKKVSEFERELGCHIANVALKKIALTEESAKEIVESEPKLRALMRGVKELREFGMDADKAANHVNLALQITKLSTIRFEGIEGVKTFAPGNDLGAFIKSEGGGKK